MTFSPKTYTKPQQLGGSSHEERIRPEQLSGGGNAHTLGYYFGEFICGRHAVLYS
jgi:hypothetical protein